MPQFNIEAARKAGYSDDEILAHLTETRKFDVSGALKTGYSKQDVINHLSTAPAISISPELLASRQAASTSEFEANKQESTVATRSREAATGVLEPFTMESMYGALKSGAGAMYDMLTGKGSGKAQEFITGIVKAPIEPVKNWVSGIREGDYDKAAYGSGGMLSQTAPAIAGAVDTLRSPAGILRDKARLAAQGKIGSSAFDITEKAVKDYGKASDKAVAQQALADEARNVGNLRKQAKVADTNARKQAAVAEANRAAEESARLKTEQQQGAARAKNATAEDTADIKTEQRRKAYEQELADQAAGEAAYAEQQRIAQQAVADKEAALQLSREGSKQHGEAVKDFEAKTKLEADELYRPVREANAKDPGVTLNEVAQGARSIESKTIKGSAEKIKQFQDLVQKAKQAAGADFLDNLDGTFSEAGDIGVGTGKGTPMLTYDQLQGYYSELGAQLAKGADIRSGGLPGDVRNAMKGLRGLVGDAMSTISERQGVGPQELTARDYWHARQELIYDSDSALSQVRKRVGVLDPEYYSEPFTKGKASGVAIDRLRQFPTTRYAKEAGALADLSEQLRSLHTESKQVVPKAKPVKPVASPVAPGRVFAELEPIPEAITPTVKPQPVPVKAEVLPRRVIPKPEAPTAESILAAKQEATRSKAYGLGRLSKYDIVSAAVETYELASGHIWTGLALPVLRFGVPAAMKADAVVKWISKLTDADVAAAAKLPGPERAKLVNSMKAIIEAEKATGRKLTVPPAAERIIAGSGNVSGDVKNRREAMELLKR